MAGTPQTVIIGIGNHEGQDITYTVQTFAVQSRFDNATNQSVIVSAVLLDQFSVTVPHNQTVEQPYTFRIMDSNTNRIEFLLFKEVPPENRSGSDLIDTTSGVSAVERSLTAMAVVKDDAKSSDFRRPGHMFPLIAKSGGVFERDGHTEATVDLLKLAGLKPCGLCCEMMASDGNMMRTPELLELPSERALLSYLFQI